MFLDAALPNLCHCDDWQKQGKLCRRAHTTTEMEMMGGKSQVLSFWELLNIFACLVHLLMVCFASGWEVWAAGGAGSWIGGKLKKARLFLFCKAFWDS
jgi:hypothetical protein